MFSTALAVLFAVLASTSGQPPAECANPPKSCPSSTCCPEAIPRFLTKALADECGMPMEMAGLGSGGPPSGPPPRGPPPCDAIICIMKKVNLVTADNKLDKAALKTFMESQYSADWKPVIEKAIQTCNSQENPSDSCPIGGYMGCFKHTMTKNCPASLWNGSDECKSIKAFIEKCPPPPPQ